MNNCKHGIPYKTFPYNCGVCSRERITALEAENKVLEATIEQLVMKDAFGTTRQKLFKQRQAAALLGEQK